MKKSVRILVLVLALLMSVSVLIACGDGTTEEKQEATPVPDDEPIDLTEKTEPDPTEEVTDDAVKEAKKVVIGTKAYSEQLTMGELLRQLIEAKTDYEVEIINFGGSSLLFEAMKSGEVQVCADYTGSFYTVYLKAEEERGVFLRDPQKVYDYCVEAVKDEYDFDILCKIGFANEYAFCLRREDKEALGIETVSELVPYAVDMKHTGSPEWFERPDALAACVEAYGIEFKSGDPMEPGLMYSAIANGDVDCISAFTSDGRINKFDLTLLEDDLHVLMPFECCPTIKGDFAKENPEIVQTLMMLENTLTTEDMQRYNLMVAEDGLSNEAVAAIMLKDLGLD